jgi:hypothetical protein
MVALHVKEEISHSKEHVQHFQNLFKSEVVGEDAGVYHNY